MGFLGYRGQKPVCNLGGRGGINKIFKETHTIINEKKTRSLHYQYQ